MRIGFLWKIVATENVEIEFSMKNISWKFLIFHRYKITSLPEILRMKKENNSLNKKKLTNLFEIWNLRCAL